MVPGSGRFGRTLQPAITGTGVSPVAPGALSRSALTQAVAPGRLCPSVLHPTATVPQKLPRTGLLSNSASVAVLDDVTPALVSA